MPPRPIHPRTTLLLALLIVLPVLLLAGPLHAAVRRVLAHADGRTYWVAVVRDAPEPGGIPRLMMSAAPATRPAPQTLVRARAVGSAESDWTQIALLSQPAAGLTARDGTLAVLLSDGQWLTVYDGGSGRFPAPGEGSGGADGTGPLRAIAQAKSALYGIVEVPAAATQPATQSATRPAGSGRLSLWAYRDSAWTRVGDLPASINLRADAPLAMTAAGDDLYLAAPADGKLGLLRWRPDAAPAADSPADPATKPAATGPATRPITGRWVDLGTIAADPAEPFDWLDNDPPAPPTLWASAKSGPGTIWPLTLAGDAPAVRLGEPVTLPKGEGAPTGPPAAAVMAGKTLRVLYAADGKLYEQDFRPDGTAELRAAKELAAPAGGPSPVGKFFNFLVLGLLLLLIVTGFRRGPVPAEALGKLNAPLAPFGLRAAAGLIDLVPLLIAFTAIGVRHPDVASTGRLPVGPLDEVILYAGMLTYVVHTLAGEWWTGRTVGKFLLRLRVARLDGEPMGPAAAFTRNLMRMVDVALAFVPLGWIFLNPLRQRLGDVVAGTVVVLNAAVTPVGPTEEALAGMNAMEKSDEPAAVE